MSDMIYDEWNEVKKTTSKESLLVGFKPRDIFYIKMGHNLGYEQNGKGEDFVRPVIVLKKLNNHMFIGIPTSSQIKKGSFFYEFEFEQRTANGSKKVKDIAILAQIKTFSTKRLLNKIGVINKDEFEKLKDKLKGLIFEKIDPA